jgi:hypothetical protein
MNCKSIVHTTNGYRLNELADVISGVFLKPSPEGTVAYIQIKDMMTGVPETTAAKVEYVPKLEHSMLRCGDLLFAGKGATYLCGEFRSNMPAVPTTTFYIIRPRSERITTEYLCWYLNHPRVVAAIKAAQVGSGTPLIHKPTLEQLEIIVPGLETQRLVVELSGLQQREEMLLKTLAEKRVQLTNQLLYNEIINKL